MLGVSEVGVVREQAAGRTRCRALVALAAAVAGLLLSGCAAEESAPAPEEPSTTPVRGPAYDPSLPPAHGVLALVPIEATRLTVTDFARAKELLGMTGVTAASPPAQQARLWRRAEGELPLLGRGVIEGVDARLREEFGFGRSDLVWAARFSGGAEGWVLRLRDGVAMNRVSEAVEAGVGPLRGARVDRARRLLSSGAASPGEHTWAAEPALVALVGEQSPLATAVGRRCVPGDTGPERLEELTAYAVELDTRLATVHLGQGREDVSARLDLAEQDPVFAAAFTHGVAAPASGRLGFRMPDPAAAADLVSRQGLPFATCAH